MSLCIALELDKEQAEDLCPEPDLHSIREANLTG